MSSYGDRNRPPYERTDWPDTRVNDLARLVHDNDERLDETIERVNDHANWINGIMKTGDRRSSRNWSLTIALVTVSGSALANIIVTIVQSHH